MFSFFIYFHGKCSKDFSQRLFIVSSHSSGSPFTVSPQVFAVNPKSMSLGELYGEYDLATNEWTDGVLSSIMRAACAGEHFTSLNYIYMTFID